MAVVLVESVQVAILSLRKQVDISVLHPFACPGFLPGRFQFELYSI